MISLLGRIAIIVIIARAKPYTLPLRYPRRSMKITLVAAKVLALLVIELFIMIDYCFIIAASLSPHIIISCSSLYAGEYTFCFPRLMPLHSYFDIEAILARNAVDAH